MIKAVYKNSGLSKEAGELSPITLLPGQWMCPLPPAPGLPLFSSSQVPVPRVPPAWWDAQQRRGGIPHTLQGRRST